LAVKDVATGKALCTLEAKAMLTAQFSSDGSRVVVAGPLENGKAAAQVLNAVTGKAITPLLRLGGPHVSRLAFSPYGRYLLAISGVISVDPFSLGPFSTDAEVEVWNES